MTPSCGCAGVEIGARCRRHDGKRPLRIRHALLRERRFRRLGVGDTEGGVGLHALAVLVDGKFFLPDARLVRLDQLGMTSPGFGLGRRRAWAVASEGGRSDGSSRSAVWASR